jgi:hypothetical protein
MEVYAGTRNEDGKGSIGVSNDFVFRHSVRGRPVIPEISECKKMACPCGQAVNPSSEMETV